MIGIFCSTTLFANLNSRNLLTLPTYLKIVSVAFVFGTILICFIEEVDYRELGKEEQTSNGLLNTLKKVFNLFSNSNFLTFISILLISKIGNIFSNSIFDLVLIDYGVTQSFYANLTAFFIPVRMIISYYFSNIQGNYLKIFMSCHIKLTLVFILEYIYLITYPIEYNSYVKVILLIIMETIKVYLYELSFSSMCGFFCKIVDINLGATYITALHSVNNLSEGWPGIFVFHYVDVFGFKVIGIVSIIYCIVYYVCVRGIYYKIDDLPEQCWMVLYSKGKVD